MSRKAAAFKRQRVPEPDPVEEEEEEDEIDFDDISDYGDEEESEHDSIHEDDDFETKAKKYKAMMLREGKIAAKERDHELSNVAKATTLEDAEEEQEGFGRDHLKVTAQHSAEELRDRIRETINVLIKFNENKEEGRTREEYLDLLRTDLMELFEYNDFLMERIMELFPPHEVFEFLEAMDKERPVTIRCNTVKAKRRDLVQALVKRGINVEPLEKWSKVGMQIFESNVPISGTVEYLAGHYMLQSAVSFIPVIALQPQTDEKILDMAAAPGGKTTYICQEMKNTGVVFANDVSEARCKALSGNVQRLGVTNCIVTNYDGVGYERVARHFDRVLLDAPCTGSGIISRDKSIKTSKSLADVQRAAYLQRQMLLSAIDATSAKSESGGIIVYSTCSFLVEENEAVVDYALRKRHVEIIDMGLPFGRPGLTKYRFNRFDAQVANSRRFLPHVHNMDGFFVCKFRKLADGVKTTVEEQGEDDEMDGVQPSFATNKKRRTEKKLAATDNATTTSATNDRSQKNSKVSVPPKKEKGGVPSTKPKRTPNAPRVSKKKAKAKKVPGGRK